MKMGASGYPPNVKTDKEKEEYRKEAYDSEGITLDSQLLDAGPNPGLRSIAKLMLNSLWGN